MSIYRSRNTTYSQKAVPRKKRAIALYGEGGYTGKFFRCWNCGFINNSDIIQRADTYKGGDSYKVVEDSGSPLQMFGIWGDTDDQRYFQVTLDNPTSINLMLLDANGEIVPIAVSAEVKITGGCRFCGSLNYR